MSTLTAIREKAAFWHCRVESGEMNEAEHAAFHDWVLADERHAREFRAAVAVAALASELDPVSRSRLEASSEADRSSTRSGWRRWVPALAAAAALCVVLVGGRITIQHFAAEAPMLATSTGTGESRELKLPDGSIAFLNTRTRVEWFETPTERRVVLLEGEALFDVAPDAQRPFRVVLDHSEIQVRGTRFNVYRKRNGEVVVTVLEGTVHVRETASANDSSAWERDLGANQRIVYKDIGLIADVHTIEDVQSAVKWREGLLQVRNQPLAEVVEELMRYTDRRIIIRDERAAQLRIGGALNTRDVRAALKRITVIDPMIHLTERGDTFTLSYRDGAGDSEE